MIRNYIPPIRISLSALTARLPCLGGPSNRVGSQQGAGGNCVCLCTYVLWSLCSWPRPSRGGSSSPFAFGLFWLRHLPAYLFVVSAPCSLTACQWGFPQRQKQPLDVATEGREGVGAGRGCGEGTCICQSPRLADGARSLHSCREATSHLCSPPSPGSLQCLPSQLGKWEGDGGRKGVQMQFPSLLFAQQLQSPQ